MDHDDLATWLQWAECPDGESVFTEHANNIGLGFADPTMVKDEGFRNLRWRPWVSRERELEAERAHRSTDALLHALLGNSGSNSSKDVLSAIAHINEIVTRRGLDQWAMPNVQWSSNRMWFSRNPVDVAGPTANLFVSGSRGPKKFTLTGILSWLEDEGAESDRRVDALLAEKEHLRKNLAEQYGIGEIHFKELHRGLEDFLVDLQDEMSRMGGSHADRFQEIVSALLARHRMASS